MEMKVKCETVWGRDRYRPSNDVANIVAKLVNRRTLTVHHLKMCEKLGIQIAIEDQFNINGDAEIL
jgi:hypothetical protein